VELRLQPREDKYYLLEIVDDPRGATRTTSELVDSTDPMRTPSVRTVTRTTTDAFRFTASCSRGASGPDLPLRHQGVDGRLRRRPAPPRRPPRGPLRHLRLRREQRPRLRITAAYEILRRAWLLAGVDDVLNPDRFDYFLGAQLRFNDEDLKSILPFAGGCPRAAERSYLRGPSTPLKSVTRRFPEGGRVALDGVSSPSSGASSSPSSARRARARARSSTSRRPRPGLHGGGLPRRPRAPRALRHRRRGAPAAHAGLRLPGLPPRARLARPAERRLPASFAPAPVPDLSSRVDAALDAGGPRGARRRLPHGALRRAAAARRHRAGPPPQAPGAAVRRAHGEPRRGHGPRRCCRSFSRSTATRGTRRRRDPRGASDRHRPTRRSASKPASSSTTGGGAP
jgi:hypothetical protein